MTYTCKLVIVVTVSRFKITNLNIAIYMTYTCKLVIVVTVSRLTSQLFRPGL